MGATMVNPDLRRKIKVKLRPDLVINKQRHAGQPATSAPPTGEMYAILHSGEFIAMVATPNRSAL